MLYLGIDQHARQITISLRDDQGDVLLARQVSTRPEKIHAFFQKLTRERLQNGEQFIAVLEVCGFNDWLIRLLRDYRCQQVILIQPEKREQRKTDRRDAAALSELLWVNRNRFLVGKPVRGVRQVEIPTTTDQEGKFELLLEGITPGRYDISVKGNHTLRNLARDVELAAGDNDTYMGTLLEGDAETVFTFNRVGLADAFTLLRSFGRCRGHPRFIANADLDESDCVWIPDFGLLARNFGKKGDVVVRAATSLPPEPPPGEGDGALLAFQRERMTVEVNETVTLTLAIDPRGEPVNGGAVDLRFDPALIEVVDVSLSDHLPFVLEEPLVDNQEGVVRFSAGVLDQALSEPFSIATLSLRVKEDTTGTTITFTDAFSATDVSGPTGSVLTEARGITLGTFKNHVYLPAITR